MDIMELGAIGEFVGAFAVIGSLIYVGLQVKQSNALNRAESVRAFARDYNTFLMQIRDPAFTDIWRRGIVDFDGLSGEEQTQVHTVLLYHLMLGLADSTIDPRRTSEFAQFLDGAFAATIKTPGFAQWWARFKGIVKPMGSSGYVDRIDKADAPELLHFMPWFAAGASSTGETPR